MTTPELPGATDEVVLYREEGALAYITLNRPQKLNALNPLVFRLLDEYVERFSVSADAKVAILHGNGTSFAAGADIEHYVGLSVAEYMAFMRYGNAVQQRMVECTKPLIAAVHGYALGGGLEVALCCDLIVAEPDAKLGLPEARLGLLPGGGGTQRLPRLIGTVRAAELLMTGRRLSGTEAVACGLALGTGESGSALEAAEALANRLCKNAPLAIQMAKVLVRNSFEAPLSSGLPFEQSVGALLYATDDAKEGIAAFVEKRAPYFKGS
jgi:enoyl-CoA hydratase